MAASKTCAPIRAGALSTVAPAVADVAPDVGQHALDHHKNQQFILDNEGLARPKAIFIQHEPLLVLEWSLCRLAPSAHPRLDV